MGWIVMALIKLEALQGGAGSKRGDGTFVSPSTCCPWVQLISAHRGFSGLRVGHVLCKPHVCLCIGLVTKFQGGCKVTIPPATGRRS